MSSIRVGMCQILIEGGAVEANLRRAEEAVAVSAEGGADIALLPECLDLGWTWPDLRNAAPIPGPHSDRLARAAADRGIYLVAGLVEREGDACYNAAVMLDPSGAVIAKHRKINVLSIAAELYRRGGRLECVETPFGSVALPICADNYRGALVISHTLGRMGARYLLSPSSWSVPADHDNLRTPYGEEWTDPYGELNACYGMAIAGVSNVGPLTAGPWRGRRCIGASIAVDGDGTVTQLPYGDAAVEIRLTTLYAAENPVQGTDIPDDLRRKGYLIP